MNFEIDVQKLVTFCETNHYDIYSSGNLSSFYLNQNPDIQIDYSNYESLQKTKQNGYYLHISVIEHFINNSSVNNCSWLKNYHLNLSTFVSQYTNISAKTVKLDDLEPEKGYTLIYSPYSFGGSVKINNHLLSKHCNECYNKDCDYNRMFRSGKTAKEIYVELAEQYYIDRGVLNFKLYENYKLVISSDISPDGIFFINVYLENKFNSSDTKSIDKHIDRFKWLDFFKVSLFYYVSNSLIKTESNLYQHSPISDVYQYPTFFYKFIKDNSEKLTPEIINTIINLEEYIDYCSYTLDSINLNFESN